MTLMELFGARFRIKNMMQLSRKIFLFLLFLGIVFAVPSALAQDADGITISATAGFDSLYKEQSWIPIQVTLANAGPSVDGSVRVVTSPTFGEELIYSAPISLPNQSNKRITLYVYLPNVVSELTVELVDADERLLANASTGSINRLSANELLYGVISPDGAELTYLENVTGHRGRAQVALLTLEELPETAVAWHALDILILNDVDTDQLTADQRTALNAWIGLGGQLVLTGGAGWQQTTAAFTDLLPVTISGSETVEDLPGLQERLGIPFRDPGPYVVTTSSLTNGELIFHQDGLPLLAAAEYGRGHIFFLALDPRLAPMLDWDGSEAVWQEVANQVTGSSSWGAGPQNSYSASSAVASLPTLALPSILQLIGFLLVYVIVVGPVNYFVLKRRGQLERAWLTIPVMVIIFSGVTYLTGFQIRGNNTIINQMSVAYSQSDSEEATVYSLLGLYSPRRSNYDLILPANTLARPFEQNFTPAVGSAGDIGAITFGNETILQDVRVDIGDVETFIAQSTQTAVQIGGQATLNLENNDVRLDVTIQNNGDIPLQTGSLLLGSTAIRVGDLAPGQAETISHVVGSATATTPAAGTTSRGGIAFAPPNSGAPLSHNASILLDSFNYYEDRELFPRYQLLESLDSGNFGSTTSFSIPRDVVIFVAWSEQAQIDVALSEPDFDVYNTTLYLVEIPLQQNIVSGRNVSLPISLLNWSSLANSGVYQPSIQNLYLNGGWAEFEYQPWPEFQSMAVEELAIALEQQTPDSSQLPPELRIWDWQQEVWVPLPDVVWGQMKLTDFEPFIGPGNAVRLRVQDNNSQFGMSIQAIYPVLTGDLQ